MPGQLPIVVLYGRAGCHLCADARVLLERLSGPLGFTVQEIDVDSDGELLSRYDTAVPVVTFKDEEIARAPIDRDVLRRRLKDAIQ